MASIEDRYGQQVENAEAKADQAHEEQEIGYTQAGRVIGKLGDGDGTGQVLHRRFPGNHSPQQTKRRGG